MTPSNHIAHRQTDSPSPCLMLLWTTLFHLGVGRF